MSATGASSDSATRTATDAAGDEPVAPETPFTMGDVDFSRANLQYLICARDLARVSPERAAVLLGLPSGLGQMLAQLDAETLAAVTQVRAPLLILRQEPWWWKRLFAALGAERPGELESVLEQAGLIFVNR